MIRAAVVVLVIGLAAGTARAAPELDADRPGFLFAGTTIPPGYFDVELGLPDSTLNGPTTLQSLDAFVRVGLTGSLELQLGGPVFNRLHAGGTTRWGTGDLAVGLKLATGGGAVPVSRAVLVGYALLPTGGAAFSSGGAGAQLYAQALWDLTERQTFGAQLGFQHAGGAAPADDGLAVVSWSVQLPANLNGEVEAEYVRAFSGGGDEAFAGAGIAWLLAGRVQLDVSADRGLLATGPDWLVGWGVSALL